MSAPRPATRPILIAGPTASGKSALALALAARTNGVIVNADSMQVYAQAPILTAQPSAAEQAQAPHRLYGHIDGREAYSTGRYIVDVQAVLRQIEAAGMVPIIVGGTGLYFKALLEGLSPVPPIPPEIRARCRALADTVGVAAVRAVLAKVDPNIVVRLDPTDAQRLVRALEVYEATGRPLSDWQRDPGVATIDVDCAIKLVVDRPRAALQGRADQRFDLMMQSGALDEMRGLAALTLSPDLPLMRALGVRPLLDHLAGGLSREAAVAAGKLETRQYIKRQQTWLKRHMMSWTSVNAQQMENPSATVDAIVQNLG
jgi:tRNA dimethylallyltransferase